MQNAKVSQRQPAVHNNAMNTTSVTADRHPLAEMIGTSPRLTKQRQFVEPTANSPRVAAEREFVIRLRPHSEQAAQLKSIESHSGTNAKVVQRKPIIVDGYAGLPLDTEEAGMTAIKSYLEQLISKHDSKGISALIEQIKSLDPDKLGEIESHREDYLLRLMTPLTQADDARRLSAALGTPIGQGIGPAIPKTIHRFWSGGPLTDSAMETLLESSRKTTGTDWQHTLWYSSAVEERIKRPEPPAWKFMGDERSAYNADQEKIGKREKQRQMLRESGYSVKEIEGLVAGGISTSGVTRGELATATDMAADSVNRGRGWDDLKYFSDIARLMYLHAEGGHHMDVDIGLGDMDMKQQYRHNDAAGEVPLMGTLARDMTSGGGGQEVSPLLSDVELHRKNPYESSLDEETYNRHVATLATRASDSAGMYNALIASRHGTSHIQAAMTHLMKSLRPKEGTAPGLSTGMAANSELLGGSREAEGFAEKRAAGFAKSVPPYLLRLQHLTAESER